MANDYCGESEVKALLVDATWGTSYDTFLGTLITRASRMIDAFHKRIPGAYYTGTTGVSRYYDGSGTRELWVDELADMPSAIQVAETGDLSTLTSWSTSADVLAHPYNFAQDGVPVIMLQVDIYNGSKTHWPKYPKAVKLTCLPGFSKTVPDEIKQATIMQVVHWFKRGQQGFAQVGAITELGSLTYAKGLDPDVIDILSIPKFQRMTI